jgi:hypothetical protein
MHLEKLNFKAGGAGLRRSNPVDISWGSGHPFDRHKPVDRDG